MLHDKTFGLRVDTTHFCCCDVSMPRRPYEYSAVVVCDVCRVTPRMLDYWVRTEVIRPAGVFECQSKQMAAHRRKAYHLFDFDNVVQIAIVRELRDAGVPLQRIRYAIERLREVRGNRWQSAWLVTDGRQVFERGENEELITCLQKGKAGQLVWSVVALNAVASDVRNGLSRPHNRPFQEDRFEGQRVTWEQRTRSA